MRDTVKITGNPIQHVWHEDTLSYTDEPSTLYEGKCELKAENVQPGTVNSQGQALIVQALILKLPVDASVNVKPGNEAVMSTCAFDPQLVGVKLRIAAPHHQSFATARRFPVTEVS
jgi:hypothetical protein